MALTNDQILKILVEYINDNRYKQAILESVHTNWQTTFSMI